MKKTKTKKVYLTLMLSLMTLFCILTLLSENTYAKEKNANDVKALQSIIMAQRDKGANVSTNLDDENQYKWSKKTGRLWEIRWNKKKLKGEIDFNKLTGLKNIVIPKNKVTKINISKLNKLEYLECSKNKLKKLNVQGHKKLEELHCANNRLRKLKFDKSMQELSDVYCSNNKITKLHIEGLAMLEKLECDYNGMKKLELKNLGDISIHCSNNKLKKLDFSKVSVRVLICAYNRFETLDTYVADVLNCSHNKIKELKGSFYNMTALVCDHNQITKLNINKPCDEFREIYCQNNNITQINFTGIKTMEKVVCDKNVELIGLSGTAKVKRK